MKKLMALSLSALLALNVAACSKKAEETEKSEKETKAKVEIEATEENVETEEATEAVKAVENEEDVETEDATEAVETEEPEEYSQAYWEAKFPEYNICPFSINVNGEDIPYYWISGLIADDDIASWAETELNWNGWHVVGDKVVDKDEKYAISEESRAQSFSSCCVYETEPFDASANDNSSTAYNFSGYTETADWPDADA